jgi:hypothetical protein
LHGGQFDFEVVWYLIHLKIGLTPTKPFDNIITIKAGAVSTWDDESIVLRREIPLYRFFGI